MIFFCPKKLSILATTDQKQDSNLVFGAKCRRIYTPPLFWAWWVTPLSRQLGGLFGLMKHIIYQYIQHNAPLILIKKQKTHQLHDQGLKNADLLVWWMYSDLILAVEVPVCPIFMFGLPNCELPTQHNLSSSHLSCSSRLPAGCFLWWWWRHDSHGTRGGGRDVRRCKQRGPLVRQGMGCSSLKLAARRMHCQMHYSRDWWKKKKRKRKEPSQFD